jgi:S-adenosylmethionine:tRNA ribosyltransferase-isomerase
VRTLVLERVGDMFRLGFDPARTVLEWLEEFGEVPLPPYLSRGAETSDDARYQTVYARDPGAVAAPTAGLHFDAAMLERLRDAGVGSAFVTLHVGAGTFQPVRVEDLLEHRMHAERYAIPRATLEAVARTRESGGRVCAVGTTSLRALESAARGGALLAGEGETDLFITPGYKFKVVERLLTNFHLPRSTLLMLVSAFGGAELMRRAYAHAVARATAFSATATPCSSSPPRTPWIGQNNQTLIYRLRVQCAPVVQRSSRLFGLLTDFNSPRDCFHSPIVPDLT